jgi:Trpc4-associated protein
MKDELLFQAMIIAPHQIEVIFVLCTLLSGRRKIFTQNTLLDLGLPHVLTRMFHRMSWDTTGTLGANPFEHQHGPHCECNPESALRVQYLRLVHNFYERDFADSLVIKRTMLSEHERRLVEDAVVLEGVEEVSIPAAHKGLMSLLLGVLVREPSDSIYRFWLSSCIEAFIRGCGPQEQLLLVRLGLVRFLLNTITIISGESKQTSKTSLQTAFDLLGEVIKNNQTALRAFGCLLTDSHTFSRFTQTLQQNLVDSNVFVRSLYLTMGVVCRRATAPAYCSHSWLQIHPLSLISAPQGIRPSGSKTNVDSRDSRQGLSSQLSRSENVGFERLHAYLQEANESLVMRLVTCVAMHSVNHENVCCVNTAIVIILQEYLRYDTYVFNS